MAPGVCVTSFRMFIRRSDFTHLTRHGLRLTPVGLPAVNSWHLRGRNYSTDNKTGDSETGKNIAKNASECSAHASADKENGAQLSAKALNDDDIKDADLTQMKVAQLRAQLRSYDLSTRGNRQNLLERLQDFLQKQQGEPTTLPTPTAPVTKDNVKNAIAALPLLANDVPKAAQLPQTTTTTKTTTTRTNTKKAKTTQTYNSSASAAQCAEINGHTRTPNSTADNNNTTSTTTTTTPTSTHLKDHKDSAANYAMPPNTCQANSDDGVSVEYILGLPHLTVPLPSRNEKCRFALRPVSQRVGDLIDMLKEEDRGIDRATVLNDCGVRIASTCNIESLLDEPFWLQINNYKYKVVPPKRAKIETEDLNNLSDIRALVAQLYEALHVGEYHVHKEQELVSKLENLKYQVGPLERQRAELHNQAERKTAVMTWVGLGLMSVQFGILARLTWWEYSWDIMEPVTYFVTYGTAMAMYAYYCMTKTEYNLGEVKDREYLLTIYKRAKKNKFDIDGYNDLKRQIAELEYDLRRLRDPLNLQLPPHVDRSQQGSPPVLPDPTSPDATSSNASKKNWPFKLPFLDSKN